MSVEQAPALGPWVRQTRIVGNPERDGYERWIDIGVRRRPSRTLPDSKKGKDYDGECAAYYLSRVRSTMMDTFRSEYATNTAYTLGQWGEEEDVRVFLKDNGKSFSKVKFTYPLIQPTVTRLRGAADNLSISAIAIPATQFAQTRKEKALQERLAMSFAARQGGMVAQAFASMGVSPDPMETEQIFESQYQDELVLGITSLMKMIALENNLESYKMEVAKSIALSGVAAIEAYAVGNRFVEQILEPSEIGWDPASVKPDFSDGEFMFHCPVMTVDQIAEEFQPDEAVIKALDKWLDVDAGSWAFGRGRIRVYKVYYKDIEKYEGGFVEEDGEKVFVPINSPTETKDGKPKYTDKDLVEPPDTQMTSTWTDKEWAAKKVVRYREVTRYGVLIPWVCLPPSVTKGANSFKPESLGSEGAYLKGILNGNGDLVLAGGKVFPQEVNPDDTYGKGFPIKMTSWMRIAGHPVAPITAARSPQRFMNQITTDLIWRLRNSGGKSVIIDTDAMAGSTMDEAEINMALKEGKPINLKSEIAGGLANAVRDFDSSPGPGFYNLFSLIPQVKAMMESSVGVFEQNFGAPQGSGQLVGTLQLQLQQAGVMQQPFYVAIAELFKQVHQYNAQAGKQFYCERPWLLRQKVGDRAASALILSKDAHYEQFRIEIVLTPNAQEIRFDVDNKIIPMRMQMGLLGQQEAADLMGRAFPSDVDAAGRAYVRKAAEAQRLAAEQAQQQAQMEGLAQAEQALIDREDAIARDEQRLLTDQAKVMQKLQQPYAVNDAKNLDPNTPEIPDAPNPIGG